MAIIFESNPRCEATTPAKRIARDGMRKKGPRVEGNRSTILSNVTIILIKKMVRTKVMREKVYFFALLISCLDLEIGASRLRAASSLSLWIEVF